MTGIYTELQSKSNGLFAKAMNFLADHPLGAAMAGTAGFAASLTASVAFAPAAPVVAAALATTYLSGSIALAGMNEGGNSKFSFTGLRNLIQDAPGKLMSMVTGNKSDLNSMSSADKSVIRMAFNGDAMPNAIRYAYTANEISDKALSLAIRATQHRSDNYTIINGQPHYFSKRDESAAEIAHTLQKVFDCRLNNAIEIGDEKKASVLIAMGAKLPESMKDHPVYGPIAEKYETEIGKLPKSGDFERAKSYVYDSAMRLVMA